MDCSTDFRGSNHAIIKPWLSVAKLALKMYVNGAKSILQNRLNEIKIDMYV